MAVGIGGVLVLDSDGCVRLDISGGRLVNLIWAPGYAVRMSDAGVTIVDPSSQVRGVVNDQFIGSGTFVDAQALPDSLKCIDPANTSFFNSAMS